MPDLVRKLSLTLKERGLKLAAAESCTGGLLAAAITEMPGASDIFERGFITYSNEAKTEMLGVPADLLQARGAVSAEVAEAMAQGALQHSNADIAVSITGIAGPDGGMAEKPVGTVYIAWSTKNGEIRHACHNFSGDRQAIRTQSTEAALHHLIDCLEIAA